MKRKLKAFKLFLVNNRYSGSVQVQLQIITPSAPLLEQMRPRCCSIYFLFPVHWPFTAKTFKKEIWIALAWLWDHIKEFFSNKSTFLFSCQFNRLDYYIHSKKVEEGCPIKSSTGYSWLRLRPFNCYSCCQQAAKPTLMDSRPNSKKIIFSGEKKQAP